MIALPAGMCPPPPAPVAVRGDFVCDRQHLLHMLRLVIDSFKKGDPAGLPFAPHLKVTYNGKTVSPGESLWQTFLSINWQEEFADPDTGYGIAYGIIEETGETEGKQEYWLWPSRSRRSL